MTRRLAKLKREGHPLVLRVLALLCFLGSACSTVRLTPSATAHLANPNPLESAIKALEATQALINDPNTSPGAKKALEDQKEQQEIDVTQILAITSGRYEYFVEGSVYVSVEPLIAIRPNFEAVAIPSIGINWRPLSVAQISNWKKHWEDNLGWSALAVQLTLGGALNPGGSGSGSTNGALGLGLSYPIAGIGALSAGTVWYQDDDEESHTAPYISVTLGDFGKKPAGPQ